MVEVVEGSGMGHGDEATSVLKRKREKDRKKCA
jgi:hypothetical protein